MSPIKQRSYLAAGAALLLMVVFVSPPTDTTFSYEAHKLAHSLVFALIALIYLQLAAKTSEADWWKPYLKALGIVLVCGAGTEFAQSFLNRSPSLQDVARDVTGASAILAIALLVRRWTLIRPSLVVGVAVFATASSLAATMPMVWCITAYANRALLFPTIWEYRSPLDMYFVKVWTGAVSGVDLPSELATGPNERAIEVSFSHETSNIALYEPSPDWRAHTRLSLTLTNPNPIPLALVVRVNSESINWFDYRFELARPERFERPTPKFVAWCSIQLSYGRAGRVLSGRGPGPSRKVGSTRTGNDGHAGR